MADTVADIAIGITADVSPLMRETARAGAAFRKFGADMQKNVTPPSRTGEGAMSAAAASATALASALGSASGAAASFGANFAKGLALGLVSAGLAAVTTNLRSTIDAMADMADEAKRVGIGVEVFQELQFGMKVAGVEAAEFSSSLAKFSENIGDAARGTGNLGKLLRENGVSVRDAGGAVRETTDILADFADIIQRVPDEATRMSLITEAFGKSGKAMTLAMADGSEGLEALKQAARDAGAVVDSDVIARAEELSDRFDALSARASTFFKEVAVGAAGAAAGIADMMNAMIAPGELDALLGGGNASSLLGPEIAAELSENGAAFRELRGEIIDYGAQLSVIKSATDTFTGSLGVLSDQLANAGYEGAAYQVDLLSAKSYKAREEFEAGDITLQEYISRLSVLGDAAQGVGVIMGDIEGVDFKGASASADAFTGSMNRLGSAALRAWNAIRNAMSAGPPAPGASGPAPTPPLIGAGGRPEFDPGDMESRGAVIRAQVAIAQKQAADAAAAAAENGGGGGGGGAGSAALDALISELETEREILEDWYAESAALLAGATDAQLEQLGGRHAAIERLEKEHQERLSGIRGMGDNDALSDTASFFNSMATITQAGGDKTLKAYKVFAAAEALINTYRAASQTLGDPTLPFLAKFGAVASIFASGMGFVNALKGGSGGGVRSSSGGGAIASGGPQSIANITLNGDTFSRSSVEDLFKQINDGLKQGRIINMVSV